jgi:Variant SH3 domain/SH3 domain
VSLRNSYDIQVPSFQDLSDVVFKDIIRPLELNRKEQQQQRDRLVNEYGQLQKEQKRKHDQLIKLKVTFHELHAKAEDAQSTVDRGKNDPTFAAKQLAKLSSAAKKAAKASKDAEKQYRSFVGDYQKFQRLYEDQMKTILNRFQELEEQRMQAVQTAMTNMLNAELSCLGALHEKDQELSRAADNMDREHDIVSFMEANKSGKEPEPLVEYIPYVNQFKPQKGAVLGAGANVAKSRPKLFGGGAGGNSNNNNDDDASSDAGDDGAAASSPSSSTSLLSSSPGGSGAAAASSSSSPSSTSSTLTRSGSGGNGGSLFGGPSDDVSEAIGGSDAEAARPKLFNAPGVAAATVRTSSSPPLVAMLPPGTSAVGAPRTQSIPPPVAALPVAVGAAAAPAQATPAVIGQAEAVFEYKAADDTEIGFDVGDVINLHAVDEDSGWWSGEINGRVGMFPGNFCKRIDGAAATAAADAADAAAADAAAADAAAAAAPANLGTTTASFDYEASEGNELTVAAGETVTVISIHDDWFMAQNANGEMGLVPGTFCSPNPTQ